MEQSVGIQYNYSPSLYHLLGLKSGQSNMLTDILFGFKVGPFHRGNSSQFAGSAETGNSEFSCQFHVHCQLAYIGSQPSLNVFTIPIFQHNPILVPRQLIPNKTFICQYCSTCKHTQLAISIMAPPTFIIPQKISILSLVCENQRIQQHLQSQFKVTGPENVRRLFHIEGSSKNNYYRKMSRYNFQKNCIPIKARCRIPSGIV